MTTQLTQAQDHHQHRGMTIGTSKSVCGDGKQGEYALLDDRVFTDEPIDADHSLLLKVIVYLEMRLAWSSVA